LVKKTLNRHRAGFEPQRAMSSMKSVKASQILGEALRAWTIIPLFVLPFTLLVVLASSNSGDHHFCEIVTLFRPPPHQDWGRARTACSRFAIVHTKSRAPAGENNYPESGLVKLPRRNTGALSPAGIFGWKVPLRLAHRRADRTRHQCPCAVRLLTFFANVEYKLD